ncbi:hypothetical protein RQP54_13605 [Curvibacter sp. APW13]|uniref:hypothetical protein n=1 Tax=Curvibacter sp. APW13 TaxID=3077236 RepID=UPI0028E09CF9|nr:hypothetical protein [Curvibacter sp. APW13]MDT8991902.1 hypothetical protein [Curvibacter sp. APW13]
MAAPMLPTLLRSVAPWLLVALCTLAGAQSAPTPKKTPSALPNRMLTVELRVGTESTESSTSQQWGTRAVADEEWQKLSVANGEKARFEFAQAQAWAWTHTAVRGNGPGSVDGVGQSLQWTQDLRTMECEVRWPGGNKPARVDVALQVAESGRGLVDGVLPQPRSSKVQTVVLAPLGQWVTLARSGPRPAMQADGAYSSRSAEVAEVRLLQIRVLVPD